MAKIKKNTLKLLTNLGDSQVKNINNWVSPYDNDENIDWYKSSPWKVSSEGERGFIIIRYIKFKNKNEQKDTRERLDRSLYDFQKGDKTKCEEVCRVLNYRLKSKIEAREAWIIKSDFIKVQGSELSQGFQAYMLARSSNEKHAKKCVRLVEMHFLNYFYYEREKPLFDYLEWHSPKVKAEYIEYLLGKVSNSKRFGKPTTLAVKTIKAIIQYINHFFKYLHVESDGKIPELRFTFPSVTKARFVEHTTLRRKSLGLKYVAANKQYIDHDTFERIYVSAGEDIKSAIWIAYKYGLRRSEVLGLEQTNVKKTHLKIDEQLLGLKTERDDKGFRVRIVSKQKGPLKNRDEAGRKIPHWYAEPNELYEHISKMKVIHPSGLTERWTALMKELGLDFEFKHLRNAFCSNALRDQNKFQISSSDVQLAMGHSDQRTTMIYLRDFRALEDDEESWTPEVG